MDFESETKSAECGCGAGSLVGRWRTIEYFRKHFCGTSGAALMGPVHMMAAKVIRQRPPQGEDATEKVANAIGTRVTGYELKKLEKKKGGEIVHFAFGATMGALYGLLASIFPTITSGAGTVFGAAVYVGAHAITIPALGLAPSPVENGFAQEGVEFVSHLVYGLVTDGVPCASRPRVWKRRA